MDERKPTIIITGHCYGSWLRRALRDDPEVNALYQILWFTDSPAVQKNGKVDSPDAEDLNKCVCYIREMWAQKQETLLEESQLPADCRRIRFPCFLFKPLWPLAKDDPRNVPVREHPFGLFPHGDSWILDKLEQGTAWNRIAEEYLALDINTIVDLDRYFELCMAESKFRDSLSDIKISEYMADHFQLTQLFTNINHPNMVMFAQICQPIWEQLGRAWTPEILEHFPEERRETPIHPSVIDHFHLQWISKADTYQYHGVDVSFEEYLAHYIAYVACNETPHGWLITNRLVPQEEVMADANRLRARLEKSVLSEQALIAAFTDPASPLSEVEAALLRMNVAQAEKDGYHELATLLRDLLQTATSLRKP
jgi:hypothetical protein